MVFTLESSYSDFQLRTCLYTWCSYSDNVLGMMTPLAIWVLLLGLTGTLVNDVVGVDKCMYHVMCSIHMH